MKRKQEDIVTNNDKNTDRDRYGQDNNEEREVYHDNSDNKKKKLDHHQSSATPIDDEDDLVDTCSTGAASATTTIADPPTTTMDSDVRAKRLAKLDNSGAVGDGGDGNSASPSSKKNTPTKNDVTKMKNKDTNKKNMKSPPPSSLSSSSTGASAEQQQKEKHRRRGGGGGHRHRSPEEVFLQALSQTTGFIVETSSSSSSKSPSCSKSSSLSSKSSSSTTTVRVHIINNNNNASETAAETTSSTNNTTTELTWDELVQQVTPSSSKTTGTFYDPFRPYLFPSATTAVKSTTKKIDDGQLNKIATTYKATMTWIRDNNNIVMSSSTSLEGEDDMDNNNINGSNGRHNHDKDGGSGGSGVTNNPKTSLSLCLQAFRKWLVYEVVESLRHEIRQSTQSSSTAVGSSSSTLLPEVELGLFLDGDAGMDHPTSYNAGLQTKSQTATTSESPLLDELFRVLSGPNGTSIVGGSFMSDLIQMYDDDDSDSHHENNKNNDDGSNINSLSSLCDILLSHAIQQLPSPDSKSGGTGRGSNNSVLDVDLTNRQIATFLNLVTSSPQIATTLCKSIVQPIEDSNPSSGESDERKQTTKSSSSTPSPPRDGATLERDCILRSLFHLGAFTVPRFDNSNKTNALTLGGGSAGSGSAGGTNNSANRAAANRLPFDDLLPNTYHNMLSSIGAEYPVAVYSRQGYEASLKSYNNVCTQATSTMKGARLAGVSTLKTMAKTCASLSSSPSARSPFFQWLNKIVNSNEAIVDLLESDLLSPETAQAYCSSRPFLLGIVTSLLEMTLPNLSKALDKHGSNAFDVRYFYPETDTTPSNDNKTTAGIPVTSKDRCLVSSSSLSNNGPKTEISTDQPERFSGSTEFFFLIGALLRLSVFSGFRVYDEYQSRMRHYFSKIYELAHQRTPKETLEAIPGYSQYQKCASVALGFDVFVRSKEISELITSYSLLQLKWCSTVVASKSQSALARIPEWVVKLPSQWLAYVAVSSPQFLQSNQGIEAVLYSTQIMSSKQSFSPPVLCQLIRIGGGFIKEGVRRARGKENARFQRRGGRRPTSRSMDIDKPQEDFEDLVDDRTLDIYTSFDQRDLGVTVFTNKYVEENLLPHLMKSYVVMDHAEGIDVEKEHHFEKFRVKSEVLDQWLWLFTHPNGASKQRFIDTLDSHQHLLNEFSSSIAEAFGFVVGHAAQNFIDIRDIRVTNFQRPGFQKQMRPLPPRAASTIDYNMGWIVGNSMSTRRMLLALVHLTKHSDLAASLGGNNPQGGKSAARYLADMFINTIDKLCHADGGVNSELELSPLKDQERSAALLQNSNLTDENMIRYFIYARRYSLLEYGLDVSILCHMLMAIAARIHIAARENHTSAFLETVSRSDLVDIQQLRNVLRRLCVVPRPVNGSELGDARYILERDGFVDISNLKAKYNIPEDSKSKSSGRRRSNRQDLMSHQEIDSVASKAVIEDFLNDLEQLVLRKPKREVAARWGSQEMTNLETKIGSEGTIASDEDYGELLSDYTVSSTSFAASAGNLLHSFDSIVRSRSAENTQPKRLIKEARKAQKLLPTPHPSTSVFIVFAEERMDVCKACITGPEGTPFDGGLFEFDILFPADFPASPPLLKFLTTGNGRTRVSSNLYSDGKVCLSLLGTYNAFTNEQRWNADTSTLAQVLVSIQQQLLNDPEPFFSEGFGHEGQRGTKAGKEASVRFNHKIRLHTVQYGMVAYLRNPPLGFEEVTKRHFALCRKRIICQVLNWMNEARDTPFFKSFVKAYEELITLLSRNDIVHHRLPGQSGDGESQPWKALIARKTDLKGVAKTHSSLTTILQAHANGKNGRNEEDIDEKKPSAVDDRPTVDANGSNSMVIEEKGGRSRNNEFVFDRDVAVLSWLTFNYFADLAVAKVLAASRNARSSNAQEGDNGNGSGGHHGNASE